MFLKKQNYVMYCLLKFDDIWMSNLTLSVS